MQTTDAVYFPEADTPAKAKLKEMLELYPQQRYEEVQQESAGWKDKYYDLVDTLNPEIEKSTTIVQLRIQVANLTEENIAQGRMLRRWRRPLEMQVETLQNATRAGMRQLEKKLQELGVERASALWCTTMAFGDQERLEKIAAQGEDYQSEADSIGEDPQWWEFKAAAQHPEKSITEEEMR